jgi:hypothetical protein
MVEHSMISAVLDPADVRWDYYVLSVHARNDNALQERLREVGRDGWELVAVDTPMAMEYHCIFKKKA